MNLRSMSTREKKRRKANDGSPVALPVSSRAAVSPVGDEDDKKHLYTPTIAVIHECMPGVFANILSVVTQVRSCRRGTELMCTSAPRLLLSKQGFWREQGIGRTTRLCTSILIAHEHSAWPPVGVLAYTSLYRSNSVLHVFCSSYTSCPA